MKKYLLLISLFTCLISAGQCQQNYPEIHKKDLKGIIQVLTSDSLRGRGTGDIGSEKAAEFISNSFQKIGLEPFRGSYFEEFDLLRSYWGEVYIQTSEKQLNNFETMVFQGSHYQNEEMEAEVVFGGRGTTEELDKIDVDGRYVLIFTDNLRAGIKFSRLLAYRNALGMILASPENEKTFESIRRSQKDYQLASRFALPDTPHKYKMPVQWDTIKTVNSILIPNSQIQEISGLSQNQLEKLIQQKNIESAPINTVNVKFEKVFDRVSSRNVTGLIRGKSDKTIVITAHYDHLGTIDDQIFSGADDNASGVAALLELAQYFSEKQDLSHNILYIATAAEESGLLGSKYHVSKESFNADEILLNINLDMVSRVDDKHSNGKYLYCLGSDQSERLHEAIVEVDKPFKKCDFDFSMNNSKDPSGIFTRSDHYNFYKNGIPSLFFFAGLHEDYHKPSDTAEKINYKNFKYRVELTGLVLEALMNGNL